MCTTSACMVMKAPLQLPFSHDALLRSVKETDWRAELETFGKGVADDSHEAQEMVHKGLSNLEHFPKQATAHLPAGLGAGLEGFGEQITGGIDPQVHLRINKVLLASRMHDHNLRKHHGNNSAGTHGHAIHSGYASDDMQA